jgi:hypothetical protein
MKRIALILLLLVFYAHNALAAPQGEYKAFTYTNALGCLGLTTEYGFIPDCYDVNQNWARYTWSQTLLHYVPGPVASLKVSQLPLATDVFSFPAFASVKDNNAACVAGAAPAGGGAFNCAVYNDGTSWVILGGSGSGGIYDIAMDYVGVPQASEIAAYTAPRILTFPNNFSGSVVSCGTSPSSSDTLTIVDTTAGVPTIIGHLVISTSCVGTFTTVFVGVTLAVNDRLTVTMPATVNGIADVAVTLAGSH